MSRPLTVGTAGHVDHGKTTLVRSLTGRDTDRLAEEKRRGISIELGFAQLNLGLRSLSLVDVPGHERFVRTMIAGASGIDLYLMVIAADDGVMPQTREHLLVLRALGIEQGVVALSRCDLSDEERRACARAQAEKLFPASEVVEVSAKTGQGLEGLRGALSRVAGAVDRKTSRAERPEDVVLHVDRAFTISGRGTVVTGTLWAGTVAHGDQVLVLPQGVRARVREIQVHDRRQDAAGAGQRVALNLAGVKREEVDRGSVLVGEGSELSPTYRMNIALEVLSEELREHERVQVHHGTRQTPARARLLSGARLQLRLESPLLAGEGDRVVIRRISPPETLGGGPVVNPQAADRHPLESAGSAANPDAPTPAPPGGPSAESLLSLAILTSLESDGDTPRGAQALAESHGMDRHETLEALKALTAAGAVVRIGPDVYYPHPRLEELRGRILAMVEGSGEVTVAQVRDALGVSRKYAQALLHHLDSTKATLRKGDVHVLRRTRVLDKP